MFVKCFFFALPVHWVLFSKVTLVVYYSMTLMMYSHMTSVVHSTMPLFIFPIMILVVVFFIDSGDFIMLFVLVFLYSRVVFLIKMSMSNIVRTTRFWNNHHQVRYWNNHHQVRTKPYYSKTK